MKHPSPNPRNGPVGTLAADDGFATPPSTDTGLDTRARGGPDTAALDEARRVLRQELRTRRDSLSDSATTSNSRQIIARLAPLLQPGTRIAGYLAFGNEVDIEPLLIECRQRNIHAHVPLVQSDHTLLFAPLDERTRICHNRYGIREPQTDTAHCIGATDLHTVLLPLLGFDDGGNRMGMGGGYYDRTFAATACPQRPRLIGVAHEIQRCDQPLASAWWDVPLDMLVTETGIRRFERVERVESNSG